MSVSSNRTLVEWYKLPHGEAVGDDIGTWHGSKKKKIAISTLPIRPFPFQERRGGSFFDKVLHCKRKKKQERVHWSAAWNIVFFYKSMDHDA